MVGANKNPSPDEKITESAEALEEQNEEVVETVEAVEEETAQQTGAADRRTDVAANRTVLAAERTYAAWVRTGLAALASGVAAQTLLEDVIPGWLTKPTGSALVLFSAFCFLAAVWSFARGQCRLDPTHNVCRRRSSLRSTLSQLCLSRRTRRHFGLERLSNGLLCLQTHSSARLVMS